MKVLITGGANGIGKATARKLEEHGHEVSVFDKDKEALEELPENIQTFHGDVSDEKRVKEVLDQVELDVLVNSAGYYEQAAIEDMNADTVQKIYESNVYGTLNFCRHALPILRKRNGRIINISSIAGRIPTPFFGVYSSSKYAVEALSDALRFETAEFDVDVVIIEPGVIDTGFNRRARQALQKYIPDSIYSEKYEEKLQSGGMNGVEPEKAANVVVSAVESRKPKRRYTVTAMALLTPKLKKALPTWLWDRIVLKATY